MLELNLFFLVLGSMVCALMAIRARRLLSSALWLAGVSVITAVILYLLGAPEVAVIELSVGAGLVTILFVFTIVIPGEDTEDLPSLVPKPLAWILFLLATILLGWLAWPLTVGGPAVSEAPFSQLLWEERALDVWVQMGIIFAGVLGILGILAEGNVPRRNKRQQPKPSEVSS